MSLEKKIYYHSILEKRSVKFSANDASQTFESRRKIAETRATKGGGIAWKVARRDRRRRHMRGAAESRVSTS